VAFLGSLIVIDDVCKSSKGKSYGQT
jgi:hypothetical protein